MLFVALMLDVADERCLMLLSADYAMPLRYHARYSHCHTAPFNTRA